MKSFRVLVCGGRDFNRPEVVHSALEAIEGMCAHLELEMVVIHGACPRGADAAVRSCRASFWVMPYRADWKAHGRAAGPIRNQQMIDEAHPDMVLAFPGGRGTADMVRRARKANIRVVEIEG